MFGMFLAFLFDPILWVIAGILGHIKGKRYTLNKLFLLCILFGGCYSLLAQTMLNFVHELPDSIGIQIIAGVMRTGVLALVSLMFFMFT